MIDVILLHGALGSAAQLTPLAAALEDRHAVHVIEFEGHGDTPGRTRPFRMQHFAENVLAYISDHQLEPSALFGYSMGGYIALMLAQQAPEHVAAVLTLGTKLAWNPDVAGRETKRLDPETLRAKLPRFVDLLQSRHRVAGGWEKIVEQTAEMMRHLGDNPDIGSDTLATITQPVRLMLGDRDTMVTLDETRDAYQRLSKGELAVLPRTPHPFEQVDVTRVAAHITEIIETL